MDTCILPVYPLLHLHVYERWPSTQVPPFLHGLPAQSLTEDLQSEPVQPANDNDIIKQKCAAINTLI